MGKPTPVNRLKMIQKLKIVKKPAGGEKVRKPGKTVVKGKGGHVAHAKQKGAKGKAPAAKKKQPQPRLKVEVKNSNTAKLIHNSKTGEITAIKVRYQLLHVCIGPGSCWTSLDFVS